jgi:hypothetical protein
LFFDMPAQDQADVLLAEAGDLHMLLHVIAPEPSLASPSFPFVFKASHDVCWWDL